MSALKAEAVDLAGEATETASPPNLEPVLSYLNCPRCHLAIRLRHDALTIRHCPRCVARSRMAVPMFPSPLPMRELKSRESPPPDLHTAA
jgi:hypothetical protein